MTEDFLSNSNFLKLFYANNKLINTPSAAAEEDLLPTGKIRCLVILPQRALLPEERDQVQKIMAACQVSPEEFELLQESNRFQETNRKYSIKEIIWMGVKPQDWGLSHNIPENVATAVDRQTWICTFDISELLHNTQAKTILWKQALQAHFLK